MALRAMREASLSRFPALGFYRSWYAPNNPVLVVASDVSTPSVRALAERYFAPIPWRHLPPRTRID